MSKLQVDDIVNKDDTGSAGFSRGAVVTGIATATSFDGNLTGNVTGTANTGGGGGYWWFRYCPRLHILPK